MFETRWWLERAGDHIAVHVEELEGQGRGYVGWFTPDTFSRKGARQALAYLRTTLEDAVRQAAQPAPRPYDPVEVDG